MRAKFFAILFALVAGLSMQSCDGEFVYVDEIVGSWQMVESDGYPVTEYESDYYTFYLDGTGVYSYYDRHGRIWDEDFRWETRPGGRLFIRYRNSAELGDVMCYYRFDGSFMYFSTEPDFWHYNVYAKAW